MQHVPAAALLSPSSVREAPWPSVVDRFIEMTRARPTAVALQSGDCVWTYEQLLASARELSEIIRRQGVPPGAFVAIHGEPSPEVITSVLATWLCDAIIVPLDITLPKVRKQEVSLSLGVAHLIDLSSDGLDLGVRTTSKAIDNDGRLGWRDCDRHTTASSLERPVLISGEAAYVFFTSGTTGRPKGVLGSHRSLAQFIHWEISEFAITAADRGAYLTRLSFDVMLQDIFVPLCCGATVVIPERSGLASFDVLQWISSYEVSMLHGVPTVAAYWLGNADQSPKRKSLRLAFFTGEPLTGRLVDRWRSQVGSKCEVINLYGPTETTLERFFYRVPEQPDPGVQLVGTAMPFSQAYVLNDDGFSCSPGEVGEICIDTAFSTLGYVNAGSEETARFMQNHLPDRLSDKLYKTGDLGTFTDNGLLAIFGRKDDQIKINGVRVEPDEIVATLEGHPAVKTCVLVADIAEHHGVKATSLTAFWMPKVTAGESRLPTSEELRCYLLDRLPTAMVPQVLMQVSKLPFNQNGKLDRAVLRSLARNRNAETDGEERPHFVGLEAAIADAWEIVLRRRPTHAAQDFFELGGDSLLAMQLIGILQTRWSITLSINDLYYGSTVAAIAKRLSDNSSEPLLIPSQEGVRGHVLSPAQECYRIVSMPDSNNSGCNIDVAFYVGEGVQIEDITVALSQMARRHDVLRSYFVQKNGQLYQKYLELEELDFGRSIVRFDDHARFESVQATSVKLLELNLSPFEWPLFRGTVARLANGRQAVLLIAHHLIADGFSMDLLSKQMSEFICNPDARQEPILSIPSVSHRDFAIWQSAQRNSAAFIAAQKYWATKFPDPVAEVSIPGSQEAVAAHCRSYIYALELDKTTLEQLRRKSQMQRCSRFAITTAALFVTLSHFLGRKDLTIAVPLFGRPRPELLHAFGNYATLSAMRQSIALDMTVSDLVRGVAAELIEIETHGQFHFGDIVDMLKLLPHSSSRYPLTTLLVNQEVVSNFDCRFDSMPMQTSVDAGRDIRFDLQALIVYGEDRAVLEFIYRSGALSPHTIRQLTQLYIDVLTATSGDLDISIGKLLQVPSSTVILNDEGSRLEQ